MHSLHTLNLSIVSSYQKQDSLLGFDFVAKYNSISLKPNLINYCRLSKFAYGSFKTFTLQPIHILQNHLCNLSISYRTIQTMAFNDGEREREREREYRGSEWRARSEASVTSHCDWVQTRVLYRRWCEGVRVWGFECVLVRVRVIGRQGGYCFVGFVFVGFVFALFFSGIVGNIWFKCW